MIDRLEDGEYICVALRNVVFMYFKTHKNIYEFRSDEMVRIYFPELEEKISMATEPEETRTFYGWFGCLSPETKEVRLNIVKDIIKELEGDYIPIYTKSVKQYTFIRKSVEGITNTLYRLLKSEITGFFYQKRF